MRFHSEALLAWYERHGRTHLPWRATRDPYRIVVSESMLQQTQVERVIPLYDAFLARFPAFAALAAADAGDVVRAWRGLGYNSRAMRLHALARSAPSRAYLLFEDQPASATPKTVFLNPSTEGFSFSPFEQESLPCSWHQMQ